jgi:hypothetical protein
MHDLYTLINKIQKAPSMYLGRASIICLQAFLSGYSIAQYQGSAAQSLQDKDFQEFPEWIRKKFNIQTSQSWANILLFYAEDEQKALDLFFKVFEEFRNRHGSVSSQVDSCESQTKSLLEMQ